MKRILLCVFVFYIWQLVACDAPHVVTKSRFVCKDGSSFVAYAIFTSDIYWKKSPFKDYEGFSVRNGTDLLPFVTAPEGGYYPADSLSQAQDQNIPFSYVQDYVKLPWGYYLNEDEITEINSSSLDSLIFLSADLPLRFRLATYWDYLNNKQLKLLQTRFCAIDYTEGPMDDIIYVSTRDTISADELELYTLFESCGGDNPKRSFDPSFFYNTAGNRDWQEDDLLYYQRDGMKFYPLMVESLQYNQARLNTLLPLVDRNLTMPESFKHTLRQEIHTAMDNMGLLSSYLNLPNKHSKAAKKQFKELYTRTKTNQAKGYLPGDKLWNIYVRILMPRLTNSFFIEDCTEEMNIDRDEILAEIGIVAFYGYY